MTDHTTTPATIRETFEAIAATAAHQTFTYEELTEHYAYTLPEAALRFDNMSDLIRRVDASGSHYFDADAVRFFKGRTDRQLFDGRFWVESRKFEDDPREYQVAWVYAYGSSLSVEKLGSFRTLDRARAAARNLAAVVAGAR